MRQDPIVLKISLECGGCRWRVDDIWWQSVCCRSPERTSGVAHPLPGSCLTILTRKKLLVLIDFRPVWAALRVPMNATLATRVQLCRPLSVGTSGGSRKSIARLNTSPNKVNTLGCILNDRPIVGDIFRLCFYDGKRYTSFSLITYDVGSKTKNQDCASGW
jgi:hypothetical protein